MEFTSRPDIVLRDEYVNIECDRRKFKILKQDLQNFVCENGELVENRPTHECEKYLIIECRGMLFKISKEDLRTLCHEKGELIKPPANFAYKRPPTDAEYQQERMERLHGPGAWNAQAQCLVNSCEIPIGIPIRIPFGWNGGAISTTGIPVESLLFEQVEYVHCPYYDL